MCNCNNGSCDRILSPLDRTHLRIEKLEKALSEERDKTEEMDVILAGLVKKVRHVSDYAEQPSPGIAHVAGIGHFQEVPYSIAIDPEASPANVPFSVALEYLKIGRKIRRAKWSNSPSRRIEGRGHGAVAGMELIFGSSNHVCDFKPSCEKMVATDWIVLPKYWKP